MSRELIFALAVSLVLTIVLELGFFFLAGKKNKKDLLLLVMVNILTNPAVVVLYWLMVFYTDWNREIIKAPLEIFAVLIEGRYYKKYGKDFRHPYLFSAAANAFSFFVGVIIQNVQKLICFRKGLSLCLS
ncbi:MAG: hypothetical protein FWH48_12225 [Oscillospiraceae bacterium]|nr:hypothetical protein [Oscillospiraceae bacterium]